MTKMARLLSTALLDAYLLNGINEPWSASIKSLRRSRQIFDLHKLLKYLWRGREDREEVYL